MVLLWFLETLSGPRPPRDCSWWLWQFQAHDHSGQSTEGSSWALYQKGEAGRPRKQSGFLRWKKGWWELGE